MATKGKSALSWEVTVRYLDSERVYNIPTLQRYDAMVEAISKVMVEFGLTGGPTLFLNRKRGEMEITTRRSVDRRTLPRRTLGI